METQKLLLITSCHDPLCQKLAGSSLLQTVTVLWARRGAGREDCQASLAASSPSGYGPCGSWCRRTHAPHISWGAPCSLL